MVWNVSGDVHIHNIDYKMEICERSTYHLKLKTLFPFNTSFCYLRSPKSRIKFNTRASEWSSCMATCPKYYGATVPHFTDKTMLDQLVGWLLDTTTDPVEKTLYPGVLSPTIWVPIRCFTIMYYSF